jgi:hypothetical protein
MISPGHVPQFKVIRRVVLFVPRRSQPWASKHLAAGEHHHEDHDTTNHRIDDAQMDQCENVESAVAPMVGFEERRRVIGPLDPQDPVISQTEPGYEDDGESDRGDSRTDGCGIGGGGGVHATRVELVVKGQTHFHATHASSHHHVDGNVRLSGTVFQELNTCEATSS